MNNELEIDITSLSYKEYADYIIESLTPNRIIEFNNAKGSGFIIRNAGSKERSGLIGPTKDIGFIAHIPSKNVYFFDRELINHASAGFRLGLDTNNSMVRDCICGYYDPVSTPEQLETYNVSRFRISGISSDPDLVNPNTMQSLIACFEKALLRPSFSDFSVHVRGDARQIFKSRNKRAFQESVNYHH
jgi:hypothetical protein